MQSTTGYFTSHRGMRLFYRSWQPRGAPRAAVVIVHGIAEHGGRYQELSAYLAGRGYAVEAPDQEGHGLSAGRRGYIAHFRYFTDDLDVFVRQVKALHPGTKIFLFGASMGGTIATAYSLLYPGACQGLMLSGAALKTTPAVSPSLARLAALLSRLAPRLGVSVLDASTLSRDPVVVSAYIKDPLVFRGKISARLGAELLYMMRRLPGEMHRVDLPLLIMHGAADRLTDPAGSRWLYERAAAADKTLKLYPEFYHEILNEPGKATVYQDIALWLDQHS